MQIDSFGTTPDGRAVERITLKNGGLRAEILTLGAVLRDLRLARHAPPLVLGLNTAAAYWDSPWFFGAIAGRAANRIAGGDLPLKGRRYQLERNFLGKHTLHGGSDGLHRQIWRIEDCTAGSATLGCRLHDGHMGFPGALEITCRYSLSPDNVLELALEAWCEAVTICSLAPHSYFNLDGSAGLHHHLLQVHADRILETDADLVPTGKLLDLAGHPKDLRRPRPAAAVPLDDNYCCAQATQPMREVAHLRSTLSGIGLRLSSNQPGLQVFNARPMDCPLPGLQGRPYGPHAGIALEPQAWPDAVHHPGFPQITLAPGERYENRSRYAFTAAAAETPPRG